jgi:glycosyltransferase involved in cell wall biosynthesis
MDKTSLSILVPAYNEEHLVQESLRRLLILGESAYLSKVQIIVVNDGSSDRTAEAVQEFFDKEKGQGGKFEWILINHLENLGKGKAIQTALARATCEIAIIHDADLEYHPKDILKMIPLFLFEEADAVYGSRFAVAEYRRVLMYRHELGNRFITFLCNLISNLNLTDVETCYKAVRTDLLKSIPIKSNDFRFEIEVTMKLAKRNAILFEVPISYSGRNYEEGKKINWKDGLKALWAILNFAVSDDIFRDDKYGSKILLRLSRAPNFNAWMAETIAPFVGQNVLEIGAGIGNISGRLIPRKKYQATDINPYYLQNLHAFKFNKPYLSVSYLDLNDVSSFRYSGERFDTVICLNVIEHLDNDEMALKNIADLLRDKGRLILLVPRGQWLFGSQDKVLGHRRRYSEANIKSLCEKAGLTIRLLVPFNRSSTLPWLINGRIFRKRTFTRTQIFALNLMTPILRRIDRFLPWPSLSIIGVLEKEK